MRDGCKQIVINSNRKQINACLGPKVDKRDFDGGQGLHHFDCADGLTVYAKTYQ